MANKASSDGQITASGRFRVNAVIPTHKASYHYNERMRA